MRGLHKFNPADPAFSVVISKPRNHSSPERDTGGRKQRKTLPICLAYVTISLESTVIYKAIIKASKQNKNKEGEIFFLRVSRKEEAPAARGLSFN